MLRKLTALYSDLLRILGVNYAILVAASLIGPWAFQFLLLQSWVALEAPLCCCGTQQEPD